MLGCMRWPGVQSVYMQPSTHMLAHSLSIAILSFVQVEKDLQRFLTFQPGPDVHEKWTVFRYVAGGGTAVIADKLPTQPGFVIFADPTLDSFPK